MANHLEATAWDSGSDDQDPIFSGLPYVRVNSFDDGQFQTSSRLESHRLASAFIKDSMFDGINMKEVIKDRLNLRDDRPISAREIARAVFALDPFCLLHGVFFAEKVWLGQPKVARAITGFIEASDVRRAESGGVKRDHVRHSISDTGGSSEGYGSIPFGRTEWTAQEIVGSFALDLAQIRSYGLGEAGSALLEAIATWEIRALLDGGLRLRTACDLEPLDTHFVDRNGTALPPLGELGETVGDLIKRCDDLLPNGGAPIDVSWAPTKKPKKGEAPKADD